ncbi:hypothetical protein N9025_02075 [Synechococcus sp. AH-707-B22]|nr:hypothetical protein [Synechococcus sp. AH-707-B22]
MACSSSLAAQQGWLDVLINLNVAKEFWLIVYAIGQGRAVLNHFKVMNKCVMRTTLQFDGGALRSGLPQLPVKASGGVVS